MKIWKTDLNKWNLDKKMKIFISIAIIVSAMIILTASTISSVKSLTEKSESMATAQVNTMCEKLENTFENYKAIAVTMMMDKGIRAYLSQEPDSPDVSAQASARDSLASLLTISPASNFLVVFDKDREDYVYSGNYSLAQSYFAENFEKDFANSRDAGYGTMKSSFADYYFNGKNYTLSIYQPIYDVYLPNREIGLLCLNANEQVLSDMLKESRSGMNYQFCMVEKDGRIITGGDEKTFGTEFPYMNYIQEHQGNFEKDGNIYIYQRVGDWNYYMLDIIPLWELYRDGLNTFVVLAVLLVLMVMVILFASTKIISRTYKPMNRVIRVMDKVSDGNLDVRIEEGKVGEDFQKLAMGFNVMMDRVTGLMNQVKQEQHQMEQIRLNALQSQIQPHFLYNILDCIHWQAAVDGNKEVSSLVKALATYYRICLSKGQDIIPLSKELAHVKSYLYIQNARYDHIIDSKIEVGTDLLQTMIPKMTLQPMVENSIYHGIKVREGKTGQVTITAHIEGMNVIIEVCDTGYGMTQEEIDDINNSISVYDENFGYGVRNVNKRIELLFGREYGLEYLKNEMEGVTVRIKLPRDYAGSSEGHVRGR